jgi:outer membrane protein assembly factor BamB
MSQIFSRRLSAWVAAALLLPAAALVSAHDWPEWRGPARTGVSTETGLPESWSPAGENLAWKAPYGGRSAPVVFGDRLYLQNASAPAPTCRSA